MILKPESLGELEACFDKYQNGYLFRGQVAHYTKDSGDVSIPTSFSRHGCIPPIMLKWCHYSRAMIRAFTGLNYFDIDLELSQAILQHYGWRSFYVDLTKSPHVAAWFASNKYTETKAIHGCEDINENYLWLVHKAGNYSESESIGHIYVIDKIALESLGVNIHDLTILQGEEGKLRFHAQQACLVGNLDDYLPSQTIAAHIQVPPDVLRSFYKKNGLQNVEDLFPSKSEDFILNTLLNLPWEKVNAETMVPTFRRALDIPEYELNENSYIKHLPPDVSLYERFWIADNVNDADENFSNTIFFKLPQVSFYSNTNKSFDLTHVNRVLDEYGRFFIEVDGLIRVIEMPEPHTFEKGVYVSKTESGLISVAALTIDHPSNVVTGIGVDVGWFYKYENGLWVTVEHEEKCPCNNDLRHELHFSLLNMLNEGIQDNAFIKDNALCFRHHDVEISYCLSSELRFASYDKRQTHINYSRFSEGRE